MNGKNIFKFAFIAAQFFGAIQFQWYDYDD